ncbi:uncharacterized protein LOC136080099 [Hydra vulgaris]|uniref:Uncharacterized protein LOC136080099 n=1 Tax=Hydra vulgaris TaxID=6087 RepID=A0ABM4BUD0_HYDVU
MVVVIERKPKNEVESYFQYELSPYPKFLFKGGVVILALKSTLKIFIINNVSPVKEPININTFLLVTAIEFMVFKKPKNLKTKSISSYCILQSLTSSQLGTVKDSDEDQEQDQEFSLKKKQGQLISRELSSRMIGFWLKRIAGVVKKDGSRCIVRVNAAAAIEDDEAVSEQDCVCAAEAAKVDEGGLNVLPTVSSIYGVKPLENFFLRKKELFKIHKYFIDLHKNPKKCPLVLHGMSGVGKTQIARQYCERYHNSYENIVWIDAAFGQLQTSIKNLYQILGFTVQDSQGNPLNIEVIIQKVHDNYKEKKTLYILDNVDDRSLKILGIYISRKPNSFTLITSQWRTWSNNVNQMIIDVFSAEDAFEYVKTNIIQNTDENIRNLVKELGYHPFAITQVKTFRILNDDNFPTEEKPYSAIKSINIVLAKLDETGYLNPLKILNCLSHCDGRNISKKFIIRISKHMAIYEEHVIDEAIGILISYSFLDCLDNEKYSMHVLTQLCCKSFQIKKISTNYYLDLIECYFIHELNRVKDHADYGKHFVLHFLHMFHFNRERMLKTFHCMTTSIKTLLVCKGFLLEAIGILKEVQSYNEKNYEDIYKPTLDTKHNIADCFYDMGKYSKALDIYCSVDKIRTKILGIDDPSTMATKNNIAQCLYKMAKFNEALEIYYDVYKKRTKIFDINHSSIIETKNNIATCLCDVGKYNEALECYYSIDRIQTETLGIKHLSTMKVKHNIAFCKYKMGEYSEALEINRFVDKIRTKILGMNHLSTMETKKNIGNCLCGLGKFNEALEIYYVVDKIRTEILDTSHSSRMKIKQNIAFCLYKMGKYNEALKIYCSVYRIRTKILGTNHPSTIETQQNIAFCLYKMGKYNEALKIFYSVDRIRTKILGTNHPSTIETKQNIAFCLYKMGKYNET